MGIPTASTTTSSWSTWRILPGAEIFFDAKPARVWSKLTVIRWLLGLRTPVIYVICKSMWVECLSAIRCSGKLVGVQLLHEEKLVVWRSKQSKFTLDISRPTLRRFKIAIENQKFMIDLLVIVRSQTVSLPGGKQRILPICLEHLERNHESKGWVDAVFGLWLGFIWPISKVSFLSLDTKYQMYIYIYIQYVTVCIYIYMYILLKILHVIYARICQSLGVRPSNFGISSQNQWCLSGIYHTVPSVSILHQRIWVSRESSNPHPRWPLYSEKIQRV